MDRRRIIQHYKELTENGFAVLEGEKQIGPKRFTRIAEEGGRVNVERMRENGEVAKYESIKIGYSYKEL